MITDGKRQINICPIYFVTDKINIVINWESLILAFPQFPRYISLRSLTFTLELKGAELFAKHRATTTRQVKKP